MKKFLLLCTILASSSVAASKPAVVGTGSSTGTYFAMGNDIKGWCSDEVEVPLEISESAGGSSQNIQDLLNKKIRFAMVQSDDFAFSRKQFKKRLNDSNTAVVANLHLEQLHLLVPKSYKPSSKSGGWGNLKSLFGKSKPQPINLDTLKGAEVSAWGGSITSAKALSGLFGLGWKVNAIEQAAAEASNKPLLIVGSAPVSKVESLLKSNRFVLLPLSYNAIEGTRYDSVYTKSSVAYSVNSQLTSTDTIAVQALLIGKKSRKDSRNLAAQQLATCIYNNSYDMADDPDTSPAWSIVADLQEENVRVDMAHFKILE
ncbi:TAXI family TRAP transporter solute-binding subunit [Photobacterium leiognathi]|uniref:TAXI family TRAP transporter solute-binding subunit n=1 Tax=Photobacterium leiognathi TaxID=553611 RepID=UPI002981A06D|nr:TAXI family TRAP transporter solute-binding subunit [Photobacterium leiognathi]